MSSDTVPFPGLFVQQILNNEFVEFDSLLPVNLSNSVCIQTSVVSGVKRPKEFVPVRGFCDWTEAWTVYVGIVAQYKLERVQDLMGYFLLI